MLSPRRLQALFLGIALPFAAAVGWLAWTLLEQDRALARQRRLDQLEAAADRVAGALFRRLAELDEVLRRGTDPPPAVVVIRARVTGIQTRPPNALLYYPETPPVTDPPPTTLVGIDTIEFQRNDPAAAIVALQPLTQSPNPTIRAGALARMGRNFVKAGNREKGLLAYQQLAGMNSAMVYGLPAGLVAAESRCTLLEQMSRKDDLTREAQLFYRALMSGTWQLPRSAFEFQREQIRRWLGALPSNPADDEKLALAATVDKIWSNWQHNKKESSRQIFPGARPMLALWSATPDELTALVAPASVLDAAMHEAGEFPAVLSDGEGRPALGQSPPGTHLSAFRAPAFTKLPWTIQIASPDDGTVQLAGRGWILGGALALLFALLAGVSFVIVRAVSKEVALARLQTDFVAAVSHEFRTPLSSISQMAELLENDRWPTPAHRRKGCEILTREAARLHRLVESLLDFARMEAGTEAYRREPVESDAMVRGIADEFRSFANGSTFEVDVPAGLPVIQADRDALRRALWNLLENAVKYSPSPANVRLEAESNAEGIAIRVRDHGIGIPAAEQAQIFQKFVRGRDVATQGYKGTGIGLAMVRHIVEGHQGRITVESAPGEGSTFTILLPAGETK